MPAPLFCTQGIGAVFSAILSDLHLYSPSMIYTARARRRFSSRLFPGEKIMMVFGQRLRIYMGIDLSC